MAADIKDRFGNMFPPVTRHPDNVTVDGQVLSYRIARPGMFATERTVSVDREAWRECLKCEEYESCYRLSTSRLLLEIALSA
jgi:hypothetical protein